MQNEIDLVKNAQNNHQLSIVELFLNYRNLMKKECRRFFLIDGEIEDLMQEAMIGFFKAIKNFNLEKNNNFSAFASMCIRNQIQTAIKKSNSQKNLVLTNAISIYAQTPDEEDSLEIIFPSSEPSPEEKVISEETVAEIKSAIREKLSSLEIQVLSEYLNGKTYNEISQKLNLNNKTIDNALSRIKKKLLFLKEIK